MQLAHVQSFVALQSKLSSELRRTLTAVKDWQYLLDCPRQGEIRVDGKTWKFRVHGAGVAFSSPDGVVVDMHQAVTQPELVDAWRLLQYFESTARDAKVYFSEAAMRAELQKLEVAGHLRKVGQPGTYVLTS